MPNNGIKDAIYFYRQQGLNVIPIDGVTKIPKLGTWQQYQTEYIQDQEINTWLEQGLFNDGCAVICGKISNGFCGIDIDDKTTIETKKINLEKLKEQGYWIEETKKGYHILARMTDNIPHWEKNGKIEFLGEKRLCIIAPSPDKKMLNGDIKTLPSLKLDDDFYNKYCELSEKTRKKTIDDLKQGVTEGERNVSAFKLACHHRDRGLNTEATKQILMEWNEKNNIPLPELELEATIKSAYRYGKPVKIYANIPKTLEEVHERMQKWLFIQDTNRIDLLLATAISVYRDGDPLWIFQVGGSGDIKTELTKSIDGLPYGRRIDEITTHTLATGKKDAWDLGRELDHNYTLLIITDLASLISSNKDEKKKIWGSFRTLYDGDIFRDTGGGVKKAYEKCHVNIIACVTSVIKNEILLHSQLGTRELQYDTEPDPKDDKEKMRRAIKNMQYKNQMRGELKETMQGFLQDKEYQETIEIPEHINEFMIDQCLKLKILRATGTIDWYTGEIAGEIEAETPTRLIQQFTIIYRALKSLDPEYPETKFKEIIERIVRSSSHPIRYDIYNIVAGRTDKWFTLKELYAITNYGQKAIKGECESLTFLGIFERKIEEERIGGHWDDEKNMIVGGWFKEVPYYRWKTY